MFTRILIANRGEIACRVIRTCRKLGVETVAVYSDADAGALHVDLADNAVFIGESPVSESYLRGDRIIAAALKTGAQAIHPGYGFLSENPDFVEAVNAAGLTFIGPSASAIRAMGLKDAAKVLMQKAGVPVVPGYHGGVHDAGQLAVEAAQIGYPVLIKAVAGGGGKGMRLVHAPGDFAAALASAQAEARTAFGNPDVLLEKFIVNPRHIEVQIFGDGKQALHLFERDCSLQRRHQKVIEEAPAPGMTDDLRAAMGRAAVRAAQAIGYAGAGTVEFIVDADGPLRADGFWFMEMNTRLQVEHPVTEAITGVDLVEWQLRVAAGEPLPLRQEDLRITGHAFEARLYAEDVAAGFLPATGRLDHLCFATEARIDAGVRQGDVISPWYDPMIGKITVHGETRAAALTGLRRALAQTEIAGTTTNLTFLEALAAHDDFARGAVDTGLIARDLDALTAISQPAPRHFAQAAILAAGLGGDNARQAGFTLWEPLERAVALGFNGDDVSVTLRVLGPDAIDATVDGARLACRRHVAGWRIDGAAAARMHMAGGRITLLATGQVIDLPDPFSHDAGAGPGGDAVLAPMPGLVTAVMAQPGDHVAAGDRLITLEAMKMEHALCAPRAGTIATVAVQVGAQVDAGAALVTMLKEAPDGPA